MCCPANKKITLSVIFSTSMCKSHGVYFISYDSFSPRILDNLFQMGEENLKKPFLSFWNCRNIQSGNNKSMEQYYIATENGQTEGPYSFESLETFYTNGKITQKSLVCIAGGQEWVEFGTVLEHEWKVQALQRGNDGREKDEQEEMRQNEAELFLTVEGLFRVVGILALIAGIISASCNTGPGYAAIGFIYLLSGAFSCLVCFWCAKVIKLLSHIVDLLTVISTRIYNAKNKD